MANKEQKKAIVSGLVEVLKDVQGIYFVDFAKIASKETNEIRKEFKNISARMLVSKNTLILLALKEIGIEVPAEKLVGQTAIILADDDATAPAKIIIHLLR